MAIHETIKQLREERRLSQKALAEKTGYRDRTSIAKIEAGLVDLTQSKILAFAAALGVSPAKLMGLEIPTPLFAPAERRLLEQYRALDPHGRELVELVTEKELSRVLAAASTAAQATKPHHSGRVIPLFSARFAAGVPEPDFGNAHEEIQVDGENPADFAIRIHGDSMEPYLPDGALAFGKRKKPLNGQIGAFLLDGGFLVKQYFRDRVGNIHLHSLNRSRKDCDVILSPDSNQQLDYFGTILMDRVPLPEYE